MFHKAMDFAEAASHTDFFFDEDAFHKNPNIKFQNPDAKGMQKCNI